MRRRICRVRGLRNPRNLGRVDRITAQFLLHHGRRLEQPDTGEHEGADTWIDSDSEPSA
jgi:hypothetical protein